MHACIYRYIHGCMHACKHTYIQTHNPTHTCVCVSGARWPSCAAPLRCAWEGEQARIGSELAGGSTAEYRRVGTPAGTSYRPTAAAPSCGGDGPTATRRWSRWPLLRCNRVQSPHLFRNTARVPLAEQCSVALSSSSKPGRAGGASAGRSCEWRPSGSVGGWSAVHGVCADAPGACGTADLSHRSLVVQARRQCVADSAAREAPHCRRHGTAELRLDSRTRGRKPPRASAFVASHGTAFPSAAVRTGGTRTWPGLRWRRRASSLPTPPCRSCPPPSLPPSLPPTIKKR